MSNTPDDITDDLIDGNPSLPGETVADYAARIAKLAAQTPQEDRAQALTALREILTSARSKPADRKAAADSLLKAAAETGKVTDATAQALAMTDEELLAEVHRARTTRNAGVASRPFAVAPAGIEEACDAPSEAAPGSSFADALSSIPDVDPLML